MKRIMCVLAILSLVAVAAIAEEAPKLVISGDSGGSIAMADFGPWTLDLDQNVKFGFGPVSLSLNAGYTLDMVAPSNVFSWGYSLAYDQTFGKLNVYASIGSDTMAFTVGTGYGGHLFDDVKVGAKISY